MKSTEVADSKGAQGKFDTTSIIVLLAVGLTPVIFATAFSEYETVKWAVAVALMAIAVVLYGVRVLMAQPITMVASRVGLMAFTFGVVAVGGALWADVPMLGAVQSASWFTFVAVFLLILAPIGRPIRYVELGLALAVGTTISALFGLLDAAGVGVFTVVWDPAGPTGAFDSSDVATAYYATVVPVLLAGAVRHGGAMRGVFGAAAALGALHFGMVAPAHTFWIALGAVVVPSVVMVLLQGTGRAVLLFPAFGAFVLAAAVAGAGTLAAGAPEGSDANRLPLIRHEVKRSTATIIEARIRNPNFAIGRTERLETLEGYPYVAGVAFDLFREKPVFGWGTGSWWTEQTNYPRENELFVKRMFDRYPAFKSTHNGYLKVAAELGGLGLLLLFGWLVGVASITLTALATKVEPENWAIEHWGLMSGAVAGASFAMVSPSFEFVSAGLPFFAILAMLTRESALLNDLKGMSSTGTMNPAGERRIDVVVLGGLLPVVVAVGLLYPVSLKTMGSYHRGLADHLMLRLKLSDADRAYQAAHDAFPYDGDVLYNRGLIADREGRLPEAKKVLEEASKLRPNDARIAYLDARRAIKSEDIDGALNQARAATRLFPNYVEAYKVLALAYDKKGRPAQAAETLRQALELEPPKEYRAPLHRELALYYKGGLGKPAVALEHMLKAAELTDDPLQRQVMEVEAEELEKQIKRERLMREGKPIPPDLMPAKPDDHGHGHGHGHGPGPGDAKQGLPALPPGTKVAPSPAPADAHDDHDH